MSNPVFQLPINLYFEDTDAMGIVYHANYMSAHVPSGFVQQVCNTWSWRLWGLVL